MAAMRRLFLQALAATPLLLAGTGQAQPRKVVGVLANHIPRAHLELGAASPAAAIAAFAQELRGRGWEEGRNLRIVWRSAEGRMDRHPQLASELARLPVDVIVGGDDAVVAAARATRTIPIVAYSMYDPVENGFAKTLAKPGGNITGVAAGQSGGLHLQKTLSLLKQLSPSIRKVALVASSRERADNYLPIRPDSPMGKAATALGLELFFLTYGDTATLPELVRSAARQGANALMFDTDHAIHYHREVREALTAEAIRQRLPLMHLSLTGAADGALMSYGMDLTARWRRAAQITDRVLRGEKPEGIPIEHMDRVEFHLNLRAAKAMGLSIPPKLLVQADRVFE